MTNTNSITLVSFLAELESHDWFCSYSSDHNKYKAGQSNESRLRDIAKTSQLHQALYKAFLAFQFEGAERPEVQEDATPAATQQTFNLANVTKLVSDGKIFTVEFIKRTNGELRKMTCRTGVKKHLKGGTKAYKPANHNLLSVFDLKSGGYRSIPIDAIRSLTVSGQHFDFAGGAA